MYESKKKTEMKKYVSIICLILSVTFFGCEVDEKLLDNQIDQLNLDRRQVLLKVGEETMLSIITTPANFMTDGAVWSVEDEEIAQLGVNGVVVGKQAGETYLTVQLEGFTARTKILVYKDVLERRKYEPKYSLDNIVYAKFDALDDEIIYAEKEIFNRDEWVVLGDILPTYLLSFEWMEEGALQGIAVFRNLYFRYHANDEIRATKSLMANNHPQEEIRDFLIQLVTSYGMKRVPAHMIDNIQLNKAFAYDMVEQIDAYEGVDQFSDFIFAIHKYSYFLDNSTYVALDVIRKEDVIR